MARGNSTPPSPAKRSSPEVFPSSPLLLFPRPPPLPLATPSVRGVHAVCVHVCASVYACMRACTRACTNACAQPCPH
eukprot:3078133-Pyramimonas_sp.AAC.1